MDDRAGKRYGYHCIAPGCTNWYYKTQDKSYHRLPLGDDVRLKKWLHNMKRKGAPVNENSHVCSDHFTSDSYEQQGCFNDDGSFVLKKTNRLKSDAVPTIFDFSSYNANNTDAPTSSVNHGGTTDRVERLLKRRIQREAEEVSRYLIRLSCLLKLLVGKLLFDKL